MSHFQPGLFSPEDMGQEIRSKNPTTFADNISLPIHGWYRYSAGFSALWAREVILQEKALGHTHIFDPFAGSGTIQLEAEVCGVESFGIEAHPIVSRVAKAKLHWREKPIKLVEFAAQVQEHARNVEVDLSNLPDLVKKCFDKYTYKHLASLIQAWRSLDDGSAISELTWLALFTIIRSCSTAGTAQWQYVLPSKTKKNVLHPYEAFAMKVTSMAQDMLVRQELPHGPCAQITTGDARSCGSIPTDWATLIITSPPYANNYDYADATRLELTVFGEISRWGDLHNAVRKHLLPSCTQHVTSQKSQTWEILATPLLDPIRAEIELVCAELDSLSKTRKGKKAYHTLIASYFADMALVWIALRRVAREGARACFVVGDSAPYGVYVPVDKWLGALAVAAGFESYSFEKTRARNVKWENRKHRVPLHEGRLWVQG